MNAHSNELRISISKVDAKENLEIDCLMNIQCLFQRVK